MLSYLNFNKTCLFVISCAVVFIAICLLAVEDNDLSEVFTCTISAVGTCQLVFTLCQRGLEGNGYYLYEPFVVFGFVVLLSIFKLVTVYANIPLVVYLLPPLLSLIGVPHSVIYWVNFVTCRLTMFTACGVCVCCLIGAFSQLNLLRINSIGLPAAFSWCILYALNVVVSLVMESDTPVVDQLLSSLTNSAASIPAYYGLSTVLGLVALIVGVSVHYCIRASFDTAPPSLEVLYGLVVFNTLMYGIDIYLFSLSLSDTVGVVAVVALTAGLSTWILKNTDSYVTLSVARRSDLSLVRAATVCLLLFVIPMVVTYKVMTSYGPTHWSSITCLPLVLFSVAASQSIVKYVMRLVDNRTTRRPWSNVDHAISSVEVRCIYWLSSINQ
jgi:hypothetical protein